MSSKEAPISLDSSTVFVLEQYGDRSVHFVLETKGRNGKQIAIITVTPDIIIIQNTKGDPLDVSSARVNTTIGSAKRHSFTRAELGEKFDLTVRDQIAHLRIN